jgi:hypothetical protein
MKAKRTGDMAQVWAALSSNSVYHQKNTKKSKDKEVISLTYEKVLQTNTQMVKNMT